jgi:chemotaxis signal transduction protein
MRELVLFTLENTRYGIWKDQILSMQDVQSLHRLPFARSSLTVLCVFGGRMQTLADLALCLGHRATRDAAGASAWLLSERESIRGFLVTGERMSVQAPEALIPAPDFLRGLPLQGFFGHDSLPVPVIDVSGLYERVRRAEREKQAAPLTLSAQPVTKSRPAAMFRVFTSSGSHFAAPGADMAGPAVSGRPVVRFPLLPPNIAGLALSAGRILPIVDLAFQVSGKKGRDNSAILEATVNGTTLGFLVDQDEGEWAEEDVLVKDLPPVLCTPWMSLAVLRGAHIAPVLELGAVMSSPARGRRGNLPPLPYSPDSRFPAMFGHQAVEVVDFSALGTIFAVPRDEVVDILPCQPFQELPMASGLVAGLADFGGELVPVLDLARIGGELPQRTADWRMIVLKNGNFRALLMCESARAARTLDRDVQRGVPVVLSFPVVYGCYTDEGAVRLVLNIEELTVHYHESDAALLLPAVAIAADERTVRAPPGPRDVQEPSRPAAAVGEPDVSREESMEPAPEPVPELPPPLAPSEPALPAEMVLSSLEPSPAESRPDEPAPAPPVPEIEQNIPLESAPASESAPSLKSVLSSESASSFKSPPGSEPDSSPESTPSLGGEDILEPIHQAPISAPPTSAPTPVTAPVPPRSLPPTPVPPTPVQPSPAQPAPPPVPAPAPLASAPPTPVPLTAPSGSMSARQTQKAPADMPRPAQPDRSAPGRGLTGRRVLFAAAAVVLLAAGVAAGLHFGIFRARTAGAGAPVPAASAPATAPTPTTTNQENTAGADSSISAETEYVVEEGDTLWDIAARFTGDAHNYRGLAATNEIADPNLITPGQVIRLPR